MDNFYKIAGRILSLAFQFTHEKIAVCFSSRKPGVKFIPIGLLFYPQTVNNFGDNLIPDIVEIQMENYFQRFVENLEHDREVAHQDGVEHDRRVIQRAQTANTGVARIMARLAVYDSLRAAPRVHELDAEDYQGLIDALATKTYQAAKEIGGNMPYTVLREIIENLIHAYFTEVVVSVFDGGNTIRISDQGPGIKQKEKAFEPGFSTATANMKRYIKGVGSGLPITKEALSFLGGAITIEDNLNQGTVITLKIPSQATASVNIPRPQDIQSVDLNKRQQQVLFLIMELGCVGPSKIAQELSISLSTAYRDLIYLEEKSLIYSDEQGKRVLTPAGTEFLDEILRP